MKVLIVIPYLALSYGGTSKVVKELADGLGNLENIQVDTVSTNAANGNTLPFVTSQWILERSYRVQYFPTWHRSDLMLSLPLMQWLIYHIHEYDIVHTHTIFSPLISFTHNLCQFNKIPYIATPHGMLEPWALEYKSFKKRLYYTQIERKSLKNASAIQAIASPEKNNIERLGFSTSVLIPNGLNKKQYANLPNQDIFYREFPSLTRKRLILFLGRIDPKKGLDLLAPAFAKGRATFANTHLVIAGPDSIGFLPTVRSYFAEARCLEAVTFTGMLSGELKYAALAAAEVYISPSYSEGFSMSILEGMAAKLPCIITENCNFPEAEKAQVAYVVPANSQAIGDALITCLQHPEQAIAMGNRAQSFIFQNYTWQQSANKLANVYRNILKDEPPTIENVLSAAL